jgi:hypothetical protein
MPNRFKPLPQIEFVLALIIIAAVVLVTGDLENNVIAGLARFV